MSREEKERRIIDLYYNQGKTVREIIKELRVSPNYVSGVLKKKEEEEKNNSIVTRNQQQASSSLSTKAYELLSQGKKPFQVAIALNIRQSEATEYCREYWRLRALHKLNLIYKETNGKIWPFWKLYQLMKEKGMTIDQVANVVEIAIHKLPYMEGLYEQVKEQVERMQRTVQRLANDIEALKYKISILDKTAFTCEQDCMRTEQQLQELIDKKNRIENLIANILNRDNKGYSKLKHIIKENVKAALSDNKQVISVAFTALLQTLKNDPEMVKLIQNITGANDGEQHKDNHINITQYFESNRDRIMNLGEKNYENLVEELTNNAIDTVASSISSVLEPSSTFLGPCPQTYIHRVEESEGFHNNEGDIAD
ncbi:MAG: hypothetical protein M3250_03310 [Thermoproteota archaeon]|nr:hypothetical protein [Thermoproteota archaeon]